MTARKKKGVSCFVSGILFLLIGGVFFATEATPDWVPTMIQVVGAVGGIFGFSFVFPDTD